MEMALPERALLMFDFHKASSKPTVGGTRCRWGWAPKGAQEGHGAKGRCCQTLILPAVSLSNRQVFPGFQRQQNQRDFHS